MELCDGLADDGERGGGARGRGEFLVDVESRLVLLTPLFVGTAKLALQENGFQTVLFAVTYNSEANP